MPILEDTSSGPAVKEGTTVVADNTQLVIQYSMDESFGVVGQQPFKNKAKFDKITNWKYVDKLNELRFYEFTVPNNEFFRANSFLERTSFVPFIKPFKGIVCDRIIDEDSITMVTCELAFHLTRRVFRQNNQPRISYGAPRTHIQFEENVKDKGVQNNDGVWSGTESYVSARIGDGGDFNGSSRVTLANESNFDFDKDDKFSVSLWIKSSSTGGATLVAKRNSSTSAGWIFNIRNGSVSDDRLTVRLVNSTINRIIVNVDNVILRDDTLHHVGFSYNGNEDPSGIKIYIDGVAQTTVTEEDTLTGSILNNTAVTIGARNDGTGNYTGVIDDVRIYAREISASTMKDLFKTRKNPPEDRELKETTMVNLIAQDILDHANTDMPSDITWKLGPGFPTDNITIEYNYNNHYDALLAIAEHLGKDLFFDNREHNVFIETKGNTFDSAESLQLNITSRPKISTDDFANQINVLGKKTDAGEQLEEKVETDTVLRFNYEKVVSNNKLNTQEHVKGVADSLLKEFQKLTPSIKGEMPKELFVKFNLQSGDKIKISQPEKKLSGVFRVMTVEVNNTVAKVTMESTETGQVRVRNPSLTDIISDLIKGIDEGNIES